jgi:N-ethylmaleimide reductase
MATLTRARVQPDELPHEMAINCYGQRADAGFIITEATQVCPEGKGALYSHGD